jgi:hypothetical protein
MTFGPSSTAAEVIDGVDLTGRRAVVTGGAAGVAPYALDPANAARLWDESLRLLK